MKCCSCTGDVYSAGNNEGGCLGLGDTEHRWKMEKIPSFGKTAGRIITNIACGSNYSAAITNKGKSFVCAISGHLKLLLVIA